MASHREHATYAAISPDGQHRADEGTIAEPIPVRVILGSTHFRSPGNRAFVFSGKKTD
jgi:hypothetical protein